MAYFEDLSAYVYSGSPTAMVNVGWLGRGHPFPTGRVDDEIVDRLIELARSPQQMMRGYHYCEFCDAESPIYIPAGEAPRDAAALGSGEIHVRDHGVTYAAPTLMIHYIQAHQYMPPDEFLSAVRQMQATDQE